MTPEQREIDMAEAQKTIWNATYDVAGIERDSVGWGSAEIESAASDARSALEELNDAFDRALEEKR